MNRLKKCLGFIAVFGAVFGCAVGATLLFQSNGTFFFAGLLILLCAWLAKTVVEVTK